MRPSRDIPDEQQIFRPITREKDSPSSDLQLEQQVIAMALNDIKEMKKTVDAYWEIFAKEMHTLRLCLKDSEAVSQALERQAGSSFRRIKKIFSVFEDSPKARHNLNIRPVRGPLEVSVAELDQKVIDMWESQAERKEKERKREEPFIVDLLRMIRRELEDLGKKTKEKTDDTLREITELQQDARFQCRSLSSTRGDLDIQFFELEMLIGEKLRNKEDPTFDT